MRFRILPEFELVGAPRDHEPAIRAYLAANFKVEKSDRIAVDPKFNLAMIRRMSSSI